MTDAKKFPIVGIGASAGGIPAMEGFFKGLPDHTGMAFVVVTHLSPDRESLLHEVIARFTRIPVVVVEHDMDLAPDTVYVMPPNSIVTAQGGALHLRAPDPVHRERKPIDLFFASIAAEYGEHAVGVVLSGGDGDGTLGVKAIKERGGLTLAQTSDEYGPTNPDMPQSAIATGLIDIQCPVDEMGRPCRQLRSARQSRPAGRRAAWKSRRAGEGGNLCRAAQPFWPRFFRIQVQDLPAPGAPSHAGPSVAFLRRLCRAAQARRVRGYRPL
jgi:chemotaxis response regulator CheB